MKKLASLKEQQEYLPKAQAMAKLAKIELAIGQYNPLAIKNWLTEQLLQLKELVLK